MPGPQYPPPDHLLRDLAVRGVRHHDHSRNELPFQPGVADRSGHVRLGIAATLLDMTGAGIALDAVRPDWIATADLSCHLFDPPAGDVSVTCHPLRVGASTVIVSAELRDETGEIRGSGRMTFARIPGSATKAAVASPRAEGREPVPFSIDGGRPLLDPVLDRCAIREDRPGRLVLEKIPYVENSFGTVNGGVVALAAEAAAASAVGEPARAVGLQVHYLEQVGSGPVEVTARIVREGAAPLCEVRLVDRGADRLVAVADVAVDRSDFSVDPAVGS